MIKLFDRFTRGCKYINCNMGKRKHQKLKNKLEKLDNCAGNKDVRVPYEDIIRKNEKFIEYYKAQGICKVEEWDEFMASLKSDLPATFRITGSKDVAVKMLEVVQKQFLSHSSGDNPEQQLDIFPLPWYPDKLAWQMNLTRKDIRRVENYYKLHNFLISETENGTISRQETVSMIPPLVLNVKSHHKVLDMCAAPGSKTAQLLEFLHADADGVPTPSGYVVANDVNNKRCYMLVHQAKRLNSPCIVIVNHDSAVFPNMLATSPNGNSVETVQFDRVLCDVPCSGDGTMRKNPDIWMKWTPANAINLHGIQTRILRRGAELLAVGGRLVYSTCSLNPIENEAVIHRLLMETNNALNLVDVTSNLPGLKYSQGLETWKVGSRNLEFYDSFDEVHDKWKTTLRPQMFPPKPEERNKFHLNRCIRILPHQQNTGAFFVAVLEKITEISPKEKTCAEESIVPIHNDVDSRVSQSSRMKRTNDDKLPQNQRKRRRRGAYMEDPFVFFKGDEDIWPDVKSFYDISDSFDARRLLVRCHVGKKKNIYLTSSAVRDLVMQNQGTIKFINTGVKTFVRSDNRNTKACAFRIANDGLESIFHYVGMGRKITIPKDDLIMLLLNDDPQQAPAFSVLSVDVQKQVMNLTPGSCILIYKEDSFTLHISGWRGTNSLRTYTSQHGTIHLLRLLGGDISKYDVNKFQKLSSSTQDSSVCGTDEGDHKNEQ